jgi:hypothetical protein
VRRLSGCSVEFLGSLDSFRRQLECPSQPKRNGQTHYNQQNKQTNEPVWNGENGQYLRQALSESPTRDGVRDGDFVNVAPLQFGKKLPEVHGTIKVHRASASCHLRERMPEADSGRNGA